MKETASAEGCADLRAGCPPAAAAAGTATVVEQVRLARDTWRIGLHCPAMARASWPGQFCMLRLRGRAESQSAAWTDPLLGRPFALFDTRLDATGQPDGIDIGYLVVGKMTRLMTGLRPGDLLDIWGPLGNGFPVPSSRRLLMVAGGIGQTPFLAAGREALGGRCYGLPPRAVLERPQDVRLLYGVRSADYLAGVEAFEQAGIPVRISTDDGSRGERGYVTSLLVQELERDAAGTAVYCCGPEPMMGAAARIAAKFGVPCWLSLETPMACGIGACFSCVTKVREGDGWDYRRVCVEGPVFRSDALWLSAPAE